MLTHKLPPVQPYPGDRTATARLQSQEAQYHLLLARGVRPTPAILYRMARTEFLLNGGAR